MVKSKTKSISSLGAFSNFSKYMVKKYMVKSKTNPSQVWVHFPIFLKLNVQSVIFSKFLHEIEAAAIYLVMERGHRKSQQNPRICVHAQVKLVYPV